MSAPTGADYKYILVWMMLDHFAILQEGEEPASSVEDGTGMFVAARKEPVELRMLACNMLQDAGAPDASGEKDSGDVLTSRNAGDTPASQKGWNEFVDTIANWCKTQKGGNDAAVNTEAIMADDVNTNDSPETAANAEAETVTNSGSAASTEGTTATNAAFTPEQEARIAELVANAVKGEVKPLVDAQTATNADAEAKAAAHKADLVGKVVANNTLTQDIAEATPVETLEALVANASGASGSAPVNGTGEAANTAPSAASIANTMNGTKEAA